jgi:hypothetical protein
MINVTVDFKNPNTSGSIAYQLNIITVTYATLLIQNTRGDINGSSITGADIIAARSGGKAVPISATNNEIPFGGGCTCTKVGSGWFTKMFEAAKDTLGKIGNTVGNVVGTAANIADALSGQGGSVRMAGVRYPIPRTFGPRMGGSVPDKKVSFAPVSSSVPIPTRKRYCTEITKEMSRYDDTSDSSNTETDESSTDEDDFQTNRCTSNNNRSRWYSPTQTRQYVNFSPFIPAEQQQQQQLPQQQHPQPQQQQQPKIDIQMPLNAPSNGSSIMISEPLTTAQTIVNTASLIPSGLVNQQSAQKALSFIDKYNIKNRT